MKIRKIEIENFKKIRSLSIDSLDGSSMYIVGKNNIGKSSVIQAIYYALGKEKLSNPITFGEETGKIEIVIKDDIDYNIKCILAHDKDRITITSANGATVPNPERFLKSITDNLIFDPFALILMDRKKRTETLKKILGIDTSSLDLKYAEIYQQRKERNILERSLKDRVNKIAYDVTKADTKKIPLGQYKEKITEAKTQADTKQLIIYQAEAKKSDIKEIDGKINYLTEKRDRISSEILALRQQIAEKVGQIEAIEATEIPLLQRKKDISNEELTAIEQNISSIKDIDVSQVMADYDKAVKHNDNVDSIIRDIAVVNELSEIKELINTDTEKLNGIISEKQHIISQSLKGEINLSIEEDEIFIDGVKLDPMNMNTAGIIDFGLAINRIMNPELRILRIQNASLLDEENLNEIISKCEAEGYQLFIEKVDSSNDELQIQIIEKA